MGESATNAADILREGAAQLFQYLVELVKLRSRVIRDADNYEACFWFSDLPKEPECFTPAWSNGEEGIDETWLSISRPEKPVIPTPPRVCVPWIDQSDLENAAKEPALKREIDDPAWRPPEEQDIDAGEVRAPRIRLASFPEVAANWNDYIANEWRPWSVRYGRWDSVQRAYRQLFSIHQAYRKQGEQFELVLGVGTFFWESPSGHRICRPIVVGHASIAVEEVSGRITVGPAADGVSFGLEQDMLETNERPSAGVQHRCEERLAEIGSIWHRERILDILKDWTVSLSADAQFSMSLARPEALRRVPQLTYAPVVMLRKRSGQTMQSALKRVVSQLQQGIAIPRGVRELCGEYGPAIEGASNESRAEAIAGSDDKELLFPLPTNEEQRQIIHRLAGKSGVLVQGPPGTGKSHTIANLICHFLAHGKRVLVTSQTPRALKVLREKIPTEILPMCVSVLGNDVESLTNLEHSVLGILRQVDVWNESDVTRQTAIAARDLQDTRATIARLQSVQREMREVETRVFHVAGTTYSGTARSIAQAIQRDSGVFGWLTDVVPEGLAPPLTTAELRELAAHWDEFDRSALKIIDYTFPSDGEVPTPDEFARLVGNDGAAQKQLVHLSNQTAQGRVARLAMGPTERFHELRELASRFMASRDGLLRRNIPWIDRAVRDVSIGQRQLWAALGNSTSDVVSSLKAGSDRDDRLELSIPEGKTLAEFTVDAKRLLRHLQMGGYLSTWFFPATAVRQGRYVWQKYRFAGELCNTSATISRLVASLERHETLDRAFREWSAVCDDLSHDCGTFQSRLATLEQMNQTLQSVLSMAVIAARATEILAALGTPTFSISDLHWPEELLTELASAENRLKANRSASELHVATDRALRSMSESTCHPITRGLIEAIETRSTALYHAKFRELIDARTQWQRARHCYELDRRLRQSAPRLADDLESSVSRDCIREHLEDFTTAWAHHVARSWLQRFVREHSADVTGELAAYENKLRTLMAKLASLRAWTWCHARLRSNPALQGALVAWQLAVRRIGRGTSVHTRTYQRDAQNNLEKCREAIPAWIMPLHRVAETIVINPEIFDVVIVDEASQTGPEGLLLRYLGKQCIVVGDDKQISPESVGVDVAEVQTLIDRYLKTIPFPETLNPRTSLFAQASVRYDSRITLREHFRCVPEIIRFSDELCYANTPLIPLRQPKRDRLPPIEVRRVVDGYCEGAGTETVNTPEAAAVVRTIVECLKDKQYADKSMGVICLQGQSQAKVIEQMLLEAVGPEPFEKRRLVCGDPYSFQGDERDVVFLTLVAATAGGRRLGPLVRDAFHQRFNVAASRARDQMWLFHSVSAEELHPDCMRRRLIEFCYNPNSTQFQGIDIAHLRRSTSGSRTRGIPPPAPFESWFEVDVFLGINSRPFRVIPQFPIAGKRIDLVIQGNKDRLAVECDGDEWHGPDQFEADMARQRMLERCGWKFVRIRSSLFYANRDAALARIFDTLEELGIEPSVDVDQASTYSWIGEISGKDCLAELSLRPDHVTLPSSPFVLDETPEDSAARGSGEPFSPRDDGFLVTSAPTNTRVEIEPKVTLETNEMPVQRSLFAGVESLNATPAELEKYAQYTRDMNAVKLPVRPLMEWLEYLRSRQRSQNV